MIFPLYGILQKSARFRQSLKPSYVTRSTRIDAVQDLTIYRKASNNLISGTSSKWNRQCAGWQWRNTRWKVLLLRLLFVSSFRKVALEVGWRRGYVAVFGGWDHAPERPSIEHQHRRTSL